MLLWGWRVGIRVGLGVVTVVGCAVGVIVGSDITLGVGAALKLLSILLVDMERNAANTKVTIKMAATATIIMLLWRSDRL